MKEKEYLTLAQLGKILGISRIAVYKKVKKGQIKAKKIGRMYIVPVEQVSSILGESLDEKRKKEIEVAVKRTVEEYGETLKLLGRE